MSDEQFRRPGAQPLADVPPSNPRAAVWRPEAEPVVEPTVHASQPSQWPSVRGQRRSSVRNGIVVGFAGLGVGLAIGSLFLSPTAATPLAITRDTFPREVFGQQRDGYLTPIVEGLDAQLQDQLDAYRFAYGGDGARFGYGEYALTIVNGRMSTVLPTGSGADPRETPWVVSLRSSTTLCVSEDPPEGEPPPFELSDILADDSKDVFYWLDENRTEALTECVLFDEERNLSLRLEGSGRVEGNLQTAGWLRDELVEIHADLIE